ncbi:superinfection immunity protein [Burkholderia ambifaria]|uniref:superinfection immunity protein n=1 Tax=Burkholderia ambifaria TaxID=152480 RepID=UPI002FDF0B39
MDFSHSALEVLELGIDLVVFYRLIKLYFWPTSIARERNHCSKDAIFALNLIFGLSGIGWFIALFWALSAPRYGS